MTTFLHLTKDLCINPEHIEAVQIHKETTKDYAKDTTTTHTFLRLNTLRFTYYLRDEDLPHAVKALIDNKIIPPEWEEELQ